MQGNCPVCGAPLKGNSCEYCGYKGESEKVVASTSSQPNVSTKDFPTLIKWAFK